MNTRCASTLFVVAMSAIAVVYGAPADAVSALSVSARRAVLYGATVGASNGVMCECTFTKEQAQGNTFVDCPAPNSFGVCMTTFYTTKELGKITVRQGIPEPLKDECGKTFYNETIPDFFVPNSEMFVIEAHDTCCNTDNCNK